MHMDGLECIVPWESVHRLPWRASDGAGQGRKRAQPVVGQRSRLSVVYAIVTIRFKVTI